MPRRSARRSREPNVQAIIEDHFRAGFSGLLVAERFVRAATSFGPRPRSAWHLLRAYAFPIGKLVHLVSADTGAVSDVTQAITHGLTDALTGMAVAFSNSLVGIGSAVVLTVVGVVNNVADRRTALMVQMETHLDRVVSQRRGSGR